MAKFIVDPEGAEPFTASIKGRELWALERLIVAGEKGCTPITQPAPRWSDYIFKLRARGIAIETVHGQHGGDFPGTHGRYVLRSKARLIADDMARKGGDA